MSFGDVAFELGDAHHPLCRLTKTLPGTYAIYRILDTGDVSRRHRAHLVFRGAAGPEVARELRQSSGLGQVEVVSEDASGASLLVEAPLEGGAPTLAALPGTFARHGLLAVFDPLIASGGRLRVRAMIPRATEAQEALRALQEVPRACGFGDFRIQRIGDLEPSIHVEDVRRSLPPEHESLLALAAAMGYYETPKVVTLEEIARAVGLSISPVHKRLKAAEEAIVSRHVSSETTEAKRRARNGGGVRLAPTTPWELQLRVRMDAGLSAAIGQVPGARGALHVLSCDGARAQVSALILLVAEEKQDTLLAAIQARPEVERCEVVSRSSAHVACRLTTRERGAYSLGWWSDTWGADASIRCIVFRDGEAHIRAILARPHTPASLTGRLEETARAGSWTEWDVVALRPLADGVPPASWPEPLTPRQLEVLRVAHALGYYRTPRGCTLEHVASTLGVSANAIHKNLVLAESKLIAAYLAGGL